MVQRCHALFCRQLCHHPLIFRRKKVPWARHRLYRDRVHAIVVMLLNSNVLKNMHGKKCCKVSVRNSPHWLHLVKCDSRTHRSWLSQQGLLRASDFPNRGKVSRAATTSSEGSWFGDGWVFLFYFFPLRGNHSQSYYSLKHRAITAQMWGQLLLLCWLLKHSE